jgi:hypothetical protein
MNITSQDQSDFWFGMARHPRLWQAVLDEARDEYLHFSSANDNY